MSAFDEFFTATREAFGRNRDTDWGTVGLVLCALVLLALVLTLVLRRRSAQRQMAGEIAALAEAGGLDDEDLDFLRASADAAGLSLREVMTSLAPFEHATADALTSERPPTRPSPGSAFERVRRLRKALGFAPLAPHLWLLTTRELADGDAVVVDGEHGQVVELNEASFAVDLPAAAIPAAGATAALTIHRPQDARYLTRVRVLAVEATPGGTAEEGRGPGLRRAFFTHDEQPQRQQQREHVRVPVHGAVKVIIVDLGPGAGAAPRPAGITGTLVDLSAGGLALDLPISSERPLRRGARIRCSFLVGERQSFEDLGALVVAATPGPAAGTQHLRASFTGLSEAKRDALAAAVAAQERSLAHLTHAAQ